VARSTYLRLSSAKPTAASLAPQCTGSAAYYRLLNDLRKAVRLRQAVRLEHLLQFSEIFEQQEVEETDEQEWQALQAALEDALVDLTAMRAREGSQLEEDFGSALTSCPSGSTLSKRGPGTGSRERDRLRERVAQLVGDQHYDQSRLELELAILADKVDVTGRVRAVPQPRQVLPAGAGGRRVGRTKAQLPDPGAEPGGEHHRLEIQRHDDCPTVVGVKEELERIREQLQNIE